MAYASIIYTSASGTTFALTNSNGDPIEYLRQADISVTVNGVLKTQGTDYTFNSAGTAIVLGTAVSGATVVISRTTEIADATVNFTAGSTLTAQDLNNSDKQYRFALQEFSDLYDPLRTGTGDLGDLGGFIDSGETWVSDNGHAPTTAAVDARVDSKIDTALTTDVVAGDAITITDNSPSSGQITVGVTNASISTAKLVDSSVTTAKIADGNVTTAKILDANVTTAKLADSNVTTAKIADSAITTAKIADGAVSEIKLATDVVTTAKILDSNVTTGKLANNAVTTAKLADSSVTSAKIVDGTIVAGDLASDSVTTAKIVDSNVTTAKINDSAVTTGKIADSAVTAAKIADNVITSAKINAGTIITAAEQSSCVPDDVTFFTTSATDGRYVNVTGDSMTGALAMGSNKITNLATPTVSTDAASKGYVDGLIASASIPDADYGDITVSGSGTSWIIDNGVVTSAKIADGTIVNADINASAAIAKTKISGTAITAADVGTVDSTIIADGSITNTKVSASAAIDGTKISPDFGSQNVVTTGTSTAGSFTPTSSTVPGDGIYLPAANSIAIATNGSNRFHITSGGLVGIGTSSPETSLHVSGITRVTSGADGGAYQLRYSGANASSRTWRLINDANAYGDLDIQQSTTQTGSTFASRLCINASGQVGIGNTAPGNFVGNVNLVVGSAATSTTNAGVTLYSGTATYGGVYFADGTVGDQLYRGAVEYKHDVDALALYSGGSEKARIDSSGRLLVGTSTARTLFFNGTAGTRFQVENAGAGTAEASFVRNEASANGGLIILGKSRGTSTGSNTVLQTDDEIGCLDYQGADGTDFYIGARVQAFADGTPGANTMPSRLVFSTTPTGASASPTARMTIKNDGKVGIGTTSPTTLLHCEQGSAGSVATFTYGPSTGGGAEICVANGFSSTAPIYSFWFNNTTGIGNPASNQISAITGGSERLRIDSSGRVGIGLSAPGAKLHVNHTSQQVALTVESGGTALQVVDNDTVGEVAIKAVDTLATNGKYLAFYSNPIGSSAGTEYLRIAPDGVQIYNQSAPVSKSAAATLTIAELTNGIIQYTGAAATLTLPTGTNSDAFSNLYNNMTFQWSVINTGSGTCTIGAATGHTIVGAATVTTNNAGRFASRRTGTNTWVTYRLSS